MVPYCYDNIRLSCKDGKVVQTDCSSLGLACHYGECKAPSNLPCTPTIDKPQCVGNVLISCDYESFKLESRPCGDNICTTVDGVPNCYTPCQASASSSDYSNYCWGIDAYVKARCAESDDHHNVIVDIQKEEDDYYNYKDCPENEFCSEGKCAPQYSGFTQGCSANDKEFCERNIAYSCTKDWFDKYHWNATTCGVDTCVVYEDKARCAKSCSKALEGVTRNYCHYDDYDVSLASVTETCRKIEDGFYWVQDEKTGCSACNEYTGKCITHELVCDENSQNCYDPDRESCDASKDSERYRCVQGDSYRSGGSYNYPYDSVTEECIDGYWTVTNSDSCRLNGCDVKTGKCNDYSGSIHEKCTDSTDYCAYEGYVVGCEFESRNKILLSCGSGQCAQTNDDSFHCVVPCAAEDLGKIVYSECQGSNQSVYFECVKNYYGVGPEYYLLAHSETCQNGCQDGTCRGKIHPDDDRYCSQDYQFNCLNDVEAGCSGYFSPSVIAHDCREENRICVASGENNGCFEPCTEADYKKQNLLCVKNDNDEIYSQGRNCLKAGDGRYFWTPEVDEHCIHGCTEKTGECITIHELEGQSCNISTDSKCDGKYRLYCWFDYTAYDCEEQLGAGATCAMMNEGADDAEPACILPCKHVGDTKPVCESQDYEVQYSCVDTGGVKHWENDDTVNEYCKRGCDADTGKCIKLNEHEGQSCNADTDPEFCDGSNYIYCHWSEYDIGDCNEEAKDTMCALENGKTECLYPCTKAELGNSRKQCGTGWAHARLYDAVCTEFENGYFWKTGEDFISCDHDCDASTLTCTKIVTDEYERCDINSYTPSCHDNHLIYCDKS
ncbi:MAG: hypothetical protein J6A01_06680, partial [Proteobacteria bacterium]|nr:hypothetical protein [Pseudomonadota bacterium]